MSTPKHSILPTTLADLPTLAEYLHSSKLALTINRLLILDWPNDAVQKPLYRKAIEGGFQAAAVENLKVVDDETGEILGFLALTRKRPGAEEEIREQGEEEKQKEEEKTPEGLNPVVLKAVSEAVREVTRDVEGIDHFVITYIYVKPSRRCHGIGSELVRVCFERAKAEGIPLTVSTEPAGYEFFSKLGFKDTRHVDFDLSEWAPPYSGFGIFRLAGMIWEH